MVLHVEYISWLKKGGCLLVCDLVSQQNESVFENCFNDIEFQNI